MLAVFLLCLFSNLPGFCVGNLANDVSAIISNLTTSYDKMIRPNYGEKPVTLGVTLYILSISELSHTNMDFSFDMYFRQYWQDPRLAFERRPSLDKIDLDAEFIKRIWVPDTFFVNAKESNIHQEPEDNQFLRITHEGVVLRSMRVAVKATCPSNFQHFPMDSQMCTLEIESFGYTMAGIRYAWNDGATSVKLSPDVSLPEFKVLGHRQRLIEVSLSSGNYSRLLLDVMFERKVGLYVIQFYLPMALMVMVSWLALWLKEVSSKIGVCMVSILSVIIIMMSIHSTIPRISYLTAIDIYFYVCFLSILAILMESVMIQDREMRGQDQAQAVPNLSVRCTGETIQLLPSQDQKGEVMKVLCGLNPKHLEWLSRVCFPVIFLIFNIVYASTYSVIARVVVDDLVHLE